MMQVKNCNIKTKCEINGCKKLAELNLFNENDSKFGIKICKNCAEEIKDALCKLFVPKCIPSPFIHTKRSERK